MLSTPPASDYDDQRPAPKKVKSHPKAKNIVDTTTKGVTNAADTKAKGKTSAIDATGKGKMSTTGGKGKGKAKAVGPTDEEYPSCLQWDGSDDDEGPVPRRKGKACKSAHKVSLSSSFLFFSFYFFFAYSAKPKAAPKVSKRLQKRRDEVRTRYPYHSLTMRVC